MGKDGVLKIGDWDEWLYCVVKGFDKLMINVIVGICNMLVYGGQVVLIDVEMSCVVGYMVSGGKVKDMNKFYSLLNICSGEQVVQECCQECYVIGKEGVLKLGDMEVWKLCLKNGVVLFVKLVIGGYNGMLVCGGLVNLSDVEVCVVVEYMVGLIGKFGVKK